MYTESHVVCDGCFFCCFTWKNQKNFRQNSFFFARIGKSRRFRYVVLDHFDRSPTNEEKPSHRRRERDDEDETGSHHSSSHGRMVCISRSGDKRTYIVDEYPNILHARGRSETEFTVVSMNSLTEGDLEDVIAGVNRDRLDIRGYGGSMLSAMRSDGSQLSYDPYAADADLSSIGTVSMTRLTSLSPSDAGESTVTATTITTIDDPDQLRRLSSVDHLYHIFRQMEKAEWVPLMSDGESMHSLYTDPSGRVCPCAACSSV